MQLRNVIRLAVAVVALGTLAIAVVVLHRGGGVHPAGDAVRASGVALVLVIASLGLEIGRAVDALASAATGQAAQLREFDDQIERDAERVQKLGTAGQNAACLLFLCIAALVWCFGSRLTAWIFGTPDTRFLVMTWNRGTVGMIYLWILTVAVYFARFASFLLLARTHPMGSARAASQQTASIYYGWRRSVVYNPPGGHYLSRIAHFRLLSALLAACLMAALLTAVSYVRVTDRGIGVVNFPGTTEVYHPWTDVSSIAETHSFGRGHLPVHGFVIQFSDGSEWQYDGIHDDSSHILDLLDPDPSAAVAFAADQAKLPLRCR